MRVMILRSIYFDDEDEPDFVKQLVTEYEKAGAEVAFYNMPACDDAEHWAGFAICEYTNISDVMVCFDFPVALIKHQCKRIILSKPLPTDPELQIAINKAISESKDIYRYESVGYVCPIMPKETGKYINNEVSICV